MFYIKMCIILFHSTAKCLPTSSPKLTYSLSNLLLTHSQKEVCVYGFIEIIQFAINPPYEPRYEKRLFANAKTKTQISCAVSAQLISAFVFATQILQSLYFLNPKFQASSHILWLYSQVCVGPGRKPRRPVFSQPGSYYVTRSNSHIGI